METLPTMLNRSMAELNLNKVEASARLGVTRATLYGWLRGQTPSSPKHIDAIVGFTGEDKLNVLLATGWITDDDLPSGLVTRPLPFSSSHLHERVA